MNRYLRAAIVGSLEVLARQLIRKVAGKPKRRSADPEQRWRKADELWPDMAGSDTAAADPSAESAPSWK